MLTRAAKERMAQMERERAERHERIARQAPPPTLHKGRAGGSAHPVPVKPLPKLTKAQKVRPAIRDSARGEECLLALPGICAGGTESTIWSHARWPEAGKGGATKALDLAGCFACTSCDAVFDGQRILPPGLERQEVDARWHMAHLKSLVRLAEKGLL